LSASAPPLRPGSGPGGRAACEGCPIPEAVYGEPGTRGNRSVWNGAFVAERACPLNRSRGLAGRIGETREMTTEIMCL